jgi:hypothetical protein
MPTNIPQVPGVPPLLDNSPPASPDFMSSDSPDLASDGTTPQWGIFRNGSAVISADTVADFEYRQDWRVADYQVEKGAFESYDKVATPFEGKIRFAAGGSLDNRKAFLDSIAAIAGDLNLYEIITPEETYSDVNIEHYDYSRRNDKGVGLIVVDIWVREIRQSATQTFTNTKSPTSKANNNGGTVQPTPATPAQTNTAPSAHMGPDGTTTPGGFT